MGDKTIPDLTLRMLKAEEEELKRSKKKIPEHETKKYKVKKNCDYKLTEYYNPDDFRKDCEHWDNRVEFEKLMAEGISYELKKPDYILPCDEFTSGCNEQCEHYEQRKENTAFKKDKITAVMGVARSALEKKTDPRNITKSSQNKPKPNS